MNLRRSLWKTLPLALPRIAFLTWKQIQQAQLLMVASSLAYTTILSIIPVLAVSFAIFQAFGGLQKLDAMIQPLILSNLAQGASEEVMNTLHGFINNAHTGAVGVGGMVGLVFTSMSLLSSVEKAINLAWQTPIKRKFFQRVTAYWMFITLGPLALSIAVGFATSNNFPLHRLLPSGTGMFLISVGLFYSIYKYVPHTFVKAKYALFSAFVTACFWNLARFSYLLYAKHVVTASAVYGSLGAIPLLLIWIYIVWVVVLSGAALTAALQKTEKDLFT